jgi:hypothetical protein
MEKKSESGVFGNYLLKLVYIIVTVLVSIVGYFITDKLKQIDNKLEKIEKLEEKVQALNKSQIQIMTHLKIPIPDYLYTSVYQEINPSHPSHPSRTPNKRDVEINYEYFIASENKKNKFFRDRRL